MYVIYECGSCKYYAAKELSKFSDSIDDASTYERIEDAEMMLDNLAENEVGIFTVRNIKEGTNAFKDVDEAIAREVSQGYGWPHRVAEEVAIISRDGNPHGLSRLLNDLCASINRASTESTRLRHALWLLLNALGERPLFDGSEVSLKEAVEKANALLDKKRN